MKNTDSTLQDPSGRTLSYKEFLSQLPCLRRAGEKAAKLLLVIDTESDERLDGLLASLSEPRLSSEQELTVICFKLRYLKRSRASLPLGTKVKYAEDYLSVDELGEIDRQAYGWIRNWYHLECLSEYKSSLCYRNIPLGNLVEHELCLDLPQFLKKVKIAKIILSQEQPSMVLLLTTDADLEKVVQFVGKAVNCTVITNKYGKTNALHSYSSIIQRITRVIGLSFDTLVFLGDLVGSKLHRKEAEKKLILFENYDRLYPILDTIRKSSDKRVILLGSEGGTLNRLAALRRKRYYRALLYHLNPAAINQMRKARQRVTRAWKGIQNNVDFHQSFDYEGLNLWPLMEGKFAFVFETLFPRGIGSIESANQGLAFYHPSIIVLNVDVPPYERAICVIAKQLGIPTLQVQHGVYVGYKGGYDIVNADKVAAWGKSQVDAYVALGNDSSKVEVVGGYLFDKLYHRSKQKEREGKAKERIYRQLNLDSQRGIFTFATTATLPRERFCSAREIEDNSEIMFRPVVEAMREFPQKQLVVKLHPMEDEAVYHRVLQEMDWAEKRTRVVKQIGLHDLIDASEVIITAPSTVALEAIILGRPVVIIQLREEERNTLYMQYPALNIWREEEIVPAIKSVLGDPEFKQTLEERRAKFLSKDGEYLVDGKSTERIINLIESMTDEHEK